jgi:hypothetical protein
MPGRILECCDNELTLLNESLTLLKSNGIVGALCRLALFFTVCKLLFRQLLMPTGSLSPNRSLRRSWRQFYIRLDGFTETTSRKKLGAHTPTSRGTQHLIRVHDGSNHFYVIYVRSVWRFCAQSRRVSWEIFSRLQACARCVRPAALRRLPQQMGPPSPPSLSAKCCASGSPPGR